MKKTSPHVLLCVTGCVQAQATPRLVNDMLHPPDGGAREVNVVATHPALQFFEQADVEKLTGRRIFVEHADSTPEFEVPHIGLAEWADVVMVYPATANTLAKCAHGMADSLVASIVLAARTPVYFGPVMNDLMYENPITQRNLEILVDAGHRLVPKEMAKGLSKSTGEVTQKEYCTERMVLSVLNDLFGGHSERR